MLALAVSACDICMIFDCNIPEVLRSCQIHLQTIFLFLSQSVIIFLVMLKHTVSLHRSGKFRDRRVRMFSAEHILPVCQLLEQRYFVEALRRFFDVVVSGNAVQFVQCLVHAAVLRAEHNGHIRQICTAVVQVLAE